MYITCPSCNTSFLIDETQIGPNGRKVKCSSCQYLWLAMPNNIQQDHQSFINKQDIEPQRRALNYAPEPGINLPVIVPNYTPLISQLIVLCTIISVILLGIIGASEKLSWHHIYNNKTQFLTASILNAKIDHKSNIARIKYNITNKGEQAVKAPLVRVQMLDKDQNLLSSYITNKSDIVIYPHDSLTLETNIPATDQKVKSTLLTLGDKLDFFVK